MSNVSFDFDFLFSSFPGIKIWGTHICQAGIKCGKPERTNMNSPYQYHDMRASHLFVLFLKFPHFRLERQIRNYISIAKIRIFLFIAKL